LLEVPFVEAAVVQIEALLRGPQRLTPLVCSNDLLAIRCIRAAHLAGLSVPQDHSVIGFDGMALGEDLTPPMPSTIVQPNVRFLMPSEGSVAVPCVMSRVANGPQAANGKRCWTL
jgi:DNA-binding LacI/PurR family transcriptional regulator